MNEDLSKLNLVQLLELLEPVPEPAPISLWPQTAGWIWLSVAILLAIAWLVYHWLARRRANAYRRAAIAEIDAAGDDPAIIAGILRRTALAAFPRTDVAGLFGEDWLTFLDKTYDGDAFRDGPGGLLTKAPYAPVKAVPDAMQLARGWIRGHRGSAGV